MLPTVNHQRTDYAYLMKDRIIKTAQLLEKGELTELEARKQLLILLGVSTCKDMKDRIIKTAQLLEKGELTELEARNLLLNLFSVSGSLPDLQCRCKELNAKNRICQKCSGIVPIRL